MKKKNRPDTRDAARQFAEQANEPSAGLMREFGMFLAHNKKWWLLPILIVLAVLALLIVLSSPAVAPFIYTLF